MSSNYDEQESFTNFSILSFQAYRDLLSENEMLHEYLQNIAALIHYQAPLKEQDRWLATMIEQGFYTPEEEE